MSELDTIPPTTEQEPLEPVGRVSSPIAPTTMLRCMAIETPAPAPAAERAIRGAPAVERAPAIVRFVSILYGLCAPAIVVWAVTFSPRSPTRGGVPARIAFFGPLVAYVLGLMFAARRVRARRGDEGAMPASLAFGLPLLHGLLGLVGSVVFAIDAITGYPSNAVPSHDALAKSAGTIGGLCWPAVMLGWLAPLAVRTRVERTGAWLAVAVLGALWMLFLGMQAGIDVDL